MSTTILYAELLVVGTGAAFFIALLFYSLFGDASWLVKVAGLSSIEKVVSLIPILSIIYLLGIIMNNVGYLLSTHLEEWLREKNMNPAENYNKIRNNLYFANNSKEMIKDFEFRRSKIRICRGWFVDSILLIVSLSTFLQNGKIPYVMVYFWLITGILLMLSTAMSWWVAVGAEIDWMNSYHNFITTLQTENPNTEENKNS
jgi:hypothetical protein